MEDRKELKVLKLAGSESLRQGVFKDFLSEILLASGQDLGALSSGFWLFREKDSEFESIKTLDATGQDIGKKDTLTLLPESVMDRIRRGAFLHIHSDDIPLSFVDIAVKNKGKGLSWLCMPVMHDGKLFGAIWAVREGLALPSHFEKLHIGLSASMVSQGYDALLRKKERGIRDREFRKMVEERIDEEKDILVRKLTDHAFYTSHHIRHPLTTILALVDLIKISWEDKKAYEAYIRQLKIESMNLDEAIRVMTAKIELD